MLYKFIMAVLLCGPVFSLNGQITSLKIGDILPETIFHYSTGAVNHEGKLPDKRYKITILDFWATWCSSCIKVFPKIEKLQAEFAGDVQFLLVNAKNTMDDSTKIKQFFGKWNARYGKPLSLASIEQDTILDKMFTHNIVPHYVWLNDEGKVLAFTSADEVTQEHIRSLLKGITKPIIMKMDQDKNRPLFTNPDLPQTQLRSYRIFIKGWFEGLGSGNRLHYAGDTLRGRAMTNMSLREMYISILRELHPGFTENRFIVDTKNIDSTLLPAPAEESARNVWQKSNMNSVELILPARHAANLYCSMLEEIDHSSGYQGRMEWRNLPCYALRPTGKTKLLISKGGETEIRLFSENNPYLKNAPVHYVVARLNNCDAVKFPVVNETGINNNIDIMFTNGFKTFDAIQKQLQQYGLKLVKTERELEVFVVRDR
ncbi:hypothetical protein DC498_25715 [Terrimonas sp.]|uniref:thioredoxin domain-containing protein n=1 Tax=Terrimonas sp. TaxID=1914338 RepID=UPI000D5155C2|nr:thioredoxin domain-containing protein [Terrimonas sp.]PVD49307.1 hypothetical protein DC498_25715 [Terrimonas sp.]